MEAAYVQPSRRPKDGRYGENPNRLQHYYQYQVVLKPSPPDIQDLYLGSLRELGIEPAGRDKRAVLYRESQFVAICEAIAGRAIAAKHAALLPT